MSRGILRFAYLLLGLMSLATFGGPFLIGAALRGGDSPKWPPDRPVEWVVFSGVTGVVVVVFIGLAGIWLANMNQLRAVRQPPRAARETRPQSDGDRGGA